MPKAMALSCAPSVPLDYSNCPSNLSVVSPVPMYKSELNAPILPTLHYLLYVIGTIICLRCAIIGAAPFRLRKLYHLEKSLRFESGCLTNEATVVSIFSVPSFLIDRLYPSQKLQTHTCYS